jgi:hypothetical protein
MSMHPGRGASLAVTSTECSLACRIFGRCFVAPLPRSLIRRDGLCRLQQFPLDRGESVQGLGYFEAVHLIYLVGFANVGH